MTLTPEEIAKLQEKASRVDQLEQRLAAVDGKKSEILDEKRQLQQRLQDLEAKEEDRKRKEMEEQGKTKELLQQERDEKEQLRSQIAELEGRVKEEQEKRVAERVKSSFVSAFAGEVFEPSHVWALFGGIDGMKQNYGLSVDESGKPTAVYGGQQVSLGELAGKLRQDPKLAYLFKPQKGSGGMGSRPPAGSGDTSANPYLPGGNVTQRLLLEMENPDLAAKMKLEASGARGNG